MKKLIFPFLIVGLLLNSCSKDKNLDYKKYKSYYEMSVIYMHRNYFIFFDDSLKENVVTTDSKYPLCSDLDSLFKLEPLEGVCIYRDSTVVFSTFSSGTDLKSIIISLVYTNDESKLNNIKTTVNEMIEKEDKGWYKFKRTISIAD
jgi:hypothetical protein